MARLVVEAEPGEVAGDPGGCLRALADVAEADGADRAEWLEKAARAAGATRMGVTVGGEPRYHIIGEAVSRGDELFRLAMQAAQKEIEATIAEHLNQ